MLTLIEIAEIVDSLTDRQARRLVESNLDVETFLAQREEKCVTYEINCYNYMIADMESLLNP